MFLHSLCGSYFVSERLKTPKIWHLLDGKALHVSCRKQKHIDAILYLLTTTFVLNHQNLQDQNDIYLITGFSGVNLLAFKNYGIKRLTTSSSKASLFSCPLFKSFLIRHSPSPMTVFPRNQTRLIPTNNVVNKGVLPLVLCESFFTVIEIPDRALC